MAGCAGRESLDSWVVDSWWGVRVPLGNVDICAPTGNIYHLRVNSSSRTVNNKHEPFAVSIEVFAVFIEVHAFRSLRVHRLAGCSVIIQTLDVFGCVLSSDVSGLARCSSLQTLTRAGCELLSDVSA